MHTKRVLHRDLKPLNIFLDDRLHVKIGDLGVSRVYRVIWGGDDCVYLYTGYIG